MMKQSALTLGAAVLALGAWADEPGNLLADYEFEAPSKVWGVDVAALDRGRIESFRGIYAPLNYMTCRSPQTFVQTVAVETNTDYVAGCVYLSAYDRQVVLQVRETGQMIALESTKDWQDGRLFFNSGTNRTLTAVVRTKGGDGIGRIFLRPRTARDPWPDAEADEDVAPLLPNGSFETGLWGYQISSREDVRYTLSARRSVAFDMSDAAEGVCSLRLELPEMPTNAWPSPTLVQSAPFAVSANARYVVRFFAKADRAATVTVGGTPLYGLKLSNTWREYKTKPVPLKPDDRMGARHARLNFTVAGCGATVWLDGITVEKVGSAARPTAPEAGVWFERPFKLFKVGADASVHAAGADVGVGAFDGSATLEVTDIDGKIVHTVRRACAFDAGGRKSFKVAVPTDTTGYYHVIVTLRDAQGVPVASNATTYAVLPQPNAIAYGQSDAGEFPRLFEWGPLNGQSAGWFNSKNAASFDETLDAFELMGVKWLRIMGLGQWFNTEVEEGRYAFVFDSVVSRIREKGFGIFVEMMSHGIPDWSWARQTDHKVLRGTHLPETNAVRRYAAAFTRHYRGKVDAINLINEMAGLHPDEYMNILHAVREGFDEAGGGIALQGPGWELPPPDADEKNWARRAFALGLGRLTDGYGIHLYDFGHWTGDVSHLSTLPIEIRPFRNGRTWAEEAELAARQYRAQYPGKPIWDTETGNHFNTFAPWMKFPPEVKRGWYTERLAAARMIRYAVLKRSYGITRWFHFMTMSFLPYHALDVLNIDGAPRSGVAALAVFRKEMDGARYLSGGRIGDSRAYEIIFRRPDGRRIAVAWDAEHETEPQLHKPPFSAQAFDLEGKPVPGDRIDGSPTYYLEKAK